MLKTYITMLVLITGSTFSLSLTPENPAAIRQVVFNQNNVELELQVIDRGFKGKRCVCPQTTFISDVDGNNGRFKAVVDMDWLSSEIPEIFSNKEYLPNLFDDSREVYVLYDVDLEFAQGKTIQEYDSVSISNGKVRKVPYTMTAQDQFILEKPEAHAYPSYLKKKKIEKGDVFVQEDSPAALLSAEIIEDRVHMIFQLVDSEFPLYRCVGCKEAYFTGAANNNNGEFSATMSIDSFNEYLPDALDNPNALYDMYEETGQIYAFVGGLKLEENGSAKSSRASVVNVDIFQAARFEIEDTDAFTFTGPYDKELSGEKEDEGNIPGFSDLID